MKFYCIADFDSSAAFKLANISTFEVGSKLEAIDAFTKTTGFEDAGIIIVTDKVASLIRDEINKFTLRNTKPLILEIPSYASVMISEREQNGKKL
ncbi:MAG: V-type ATP synthase subunit F [Candidatus Omnitrophica bacterium]|nr:V-type ATP synthase subunit F [Candidatus Omnitrophota bacterium]MCM8829002.1 V-type ATP synthase subunit F [Candidatus Omnitrophota bacterium]